MVEWPGRNADSGGGGGERLSVNHADVQEVVGVAEVFAEPLQGRLLR